MHDYRIPKTLQKALEKYDHIVEGYHTEADGFGGPKQGPWSIWIDLKDGYECQLSGCGTIHEATAKDAIEALKLAQCTR